MSRAVVRRLNAEIERQRRIYPDTLVELPREEWPGDLGSVLGAPAQRAWCSRRFIVILYCDGGRERLSVCRAELDDSLRYKDGISWDELQQIKREAGFADRWAVEVYPADAALVNVSNMRHVWLLDRPPMVGWNLEAAPAGRA